MIRAVQQIWLVLNCHWEDRVFCVFAILQFTKLSLQYWFKFWAIGSNFTGNSRLASFILACLHHVFKHLSSCYIQFVVVEWLYLVAVEGLKVTETMTIQNLNHRLRNYTCSHCQKYWYPCLFFPNNPLFILESIRKLINNNNTNVTNINLLNVNLINE